MFLCWQLPVCWLDPPNSAASSSLGNLLHKASLHVFNGSEHASCIIVVLYKIAHLMERSPACRCPSLVTRPSRWFWFYQTCRTPFSVQLRLFCCTSVVASCWPACSTTTSSRSTSGPTSERNSGSSFQPDQVSHCCHCLAVLGCDYFFPFRYFVKPSCAVEKLPPHYPISQPTVRLVEQILTLHRWSFLKDSVAFMETIIH